MAAGWVCFGLAVACVLSVVLIPLAIPFGLAATILAVITVSQGGKRPGLVLLLCSIFIPLFLSLVIGLIAAAFFVARTPVRAQAADSEAAQPQPEKIIALGDYLVAVEQCAAEYAAAKTQVQKEDTKRRCRARAAGIGKNSRTTVRGTVSNVKMAREGAAVIQYGGSDLGAFAKLNDPSIRAQLRTEIQVPMSRTEALAIAPGWIIEMTGKPVFSPGPDNFLANAFWPQGAVLRLFYRGEALHAFGTLYLQETKWSIHKPAGPARVPAEAGE